MIAPSSKRIHHNLTITTVDICRTENTEIKYTFVLSCKLTNNQKRSAKMSIVRNGLVKSAGGLFSHIAKNVKLVNLKAVKRITISFDPFGENVKSTRWVRKHHTHTHRHHPFSTSIAYDDMHPRTKNIDSSACDLMSEAARRWIFQHSLAHWQQVKIESISIQVFFFADKVVKENICKNRTFECMHSCGSAMRNQHQFTFWKKSNYVLCLFPERYCFTCQWSVWLTQTRIAFWRRMFCATGANQRLFST